MLLPILSIAAALIADQIGAGARPPSSADALFEQILAVWAEAGGADLSEDEVQALLLLVKRLWSDSGERWPIQVPWGEVVDDPFQRKRLRQDLELAWVSDDDPYAPISGTVSPGSVSFADVRRDSSGFFVSVSDTSSWHPDQEVGDSADMGAIHGRGRAYWVVGEVGDGRVSLIPISPNPLVTGVGAGGKPIDEADLMVASGEFERRRAASIRAKIEAGTATIDDVLYLLDGAVPVQMGPNGAQGGWYAPEDYAANRGGRRGMALEQIALSDARRLARLGFSVPAAALSGEMTSSEWADWAKGPMHRLEETYAPMPGYLAVMRARNRDEEAIARIARVATPGALQRYWERRLRLFLTDREAYRRSITHEVTREIPGPFPRKVETQVLVLGPETLQDLVASSVCSLRNQQEMLRRRRIFDIEGEDSSDPESIRRHLYHPEARVSVRSAGLALQRAMVEHEGRRSDPNKGRRPDPHSQSQSQSQSDRSAAESTPPAMPWRTALLDWIRWSRGNWTAYEEAILFFDRISRDAEALRLAAQLPDPTNRRYALAALARLGQYEYVAERLAVEAHPEVLAALTGVLEDDEHLGAEAAWRTLSDAGVVARFQEAVHGGGGGDVVSRFQWRNLGERLARLATRLYVRLPDRERADEFDATARELVEGAKSLEERFGGAGSPRRARRMVPARG